MKRGQTALEFLTTYGWLLMVILGFFLIMFVFANSPQSLIPEHCGFPESIDCVSQKAYGDGRLELLLQNQGEDLEITDATCIYESTVKLTTKTITMNDVETRAAAWPKGDFLHFTCRYRADNPFADQEGLKVDTSVKFTFASGDELEAPLRTRVRGG